MYYGRWLVLYLRIEIKMGHLSKRCALSGTGLMNASLQWGDQNLPVGHIVPWGLSAVNISPRIRGKGNIAGSTSTGFPSQEKIAEWEKAPCGSRLWMDPTFLRSARTRIAVKIFVASVFHELSFFSWS